MSDIAAMMARAERQHNVWRIQNPDLARRIDEQKPLLLVEQAIFSVWMEGRTSSFPKANDIVCWIAESYELPVACARRIVFQKLCESPPWLSYRACDSVETEMDDVLDGIEIVLSKDLSGLFMASRLYSEAMVSVIAILEQRNTDLSALEADAIETLRPLFEIAEGRTP